MLKCTYLFCLIVFVSLSECTTTTVSPTIKKLKEITCDSDAVYSNPNDCSTYYLCKDGAKYRLSCANELLFDPVSGKCSEIGEDSCQPGTVKCFPYTIDQYNALITARQKANIICYIKNNDLTNVDYDLDDHEALCNRTCEETSEFKPQPMIDVRACMEDQKREVALEKGTHSKFKVICYFPSWAKSYNGRSKFLVEHIDASLCTHIIYSLAVLNKDNLTITPFSHWVDIDNSYYKKALKYKSEQTKVMIQIGGWSESASSDKYSEMISSSTTRKTFIDSALEFIDEWGFDGMEFDWQYPVCWQNQCENGSPLDKENFFEFIKEIYTAFNAKGLILSTVMSRYKYIIDAAYQAKEMSEYVDWITVHSHNYYTSEEGLAGHVAALYDPSCDQLDMLNVNATMKHILSKGVPAEKLLVSVPSFGNSLTLTDSAKHHLGDFSMGSGSPGRFLGKTELLAFYEICDAVKNRGWTSNKDSQQRAGHYAYSGNEWTSYDDIEDVKRKANYIKQNGFGGGAVWTLAFDDFSNICGCGKYPILSTLSHELRGTKSDILLENCT